MSESAVDRLLAAAREGRVECDGLAVEQTGGGFTFAVPDATHTELSAAELRDVAGDHERYVRNWHFWTAVASDEPARWAFLRWLEGADEAGSVESTDRAEPTDVPGRYEDLADGRSRTWGQLRITVELDENGSRVYAVRHADDEGAAESSLETYDDPLDARELGKHDERGRYRPLKTAPTLRTGWMYPELGPAELVRTVDFVYPATVQNWYREREGELDVSHYRETAERQTGIYDIIDELDDEAVGWLAEACCVDSQCLKRREWDADEDTELDVPRGDGEFPCREPCSLVVAAARKLTTLESETTRTYEFELTLSERNQLQELVDAVADGRIDEIREADLNDGANRYRARYLRAKLFEDGELPARETGADET